MLSAGLCHHILDLPLLPLDLRNCSAALLRLPGSAPRRGLLLLLPRRRLGRKFLPIQLFGTKATKAVKFANPSVVRLLTPRPASSTLLAGNNINAYAFVARLSHIFVFFRWQEP